MSEVIYIPIDKLRVSNFNVRIDLGDLSPLAESIKKHGVLEPLLVRKMNSEYEVVAGRRRYEASKEAGLKEVPCKVIDVSDDEAIILSAVENSDDLNMKEIAEAFI